MSIEVGQTIPDVSVEYITADGTSEVSSVEVLGQGTVVLFSVPGAFTPTCHVNHLPGYLAALSNLKAAGVDKVICATANDSHVTKAWAEATNALGKIDFIADGNASFAKALGLDIDLSVAGMGVRYGRNSILIVDGIVKALNTEENPGVVTASGAPAMLEALKSL